MCLCEQMIKWHRVLWSRRHLARCKQISQISAYSKLSTATNDKQRKRALC